MYGKLLAGDLDQKAPPRLCKRGRGKAECCHCESNLLLYEHKTILLLFHLSGETIFVMCYIP